MKFNKETFLSLLSSDKHSISLTQGINELIKGNFKDPSLINALKSHFSCEFGNICEEDININLSSIDNGERVFSKFEIHANEIYIITDRKWGRTTILLPMEY